MSRPVASEAPCVSSQSTPLSLFSSLRYDPPYVVPPVLGLLRSHQDGGV